MDGHGAEALPLEEAGHEVSVALRDAEGQGATAAAVLELVVGVSGAVLRGDVAGQLLLVEEVAAVGALGGGGEGEQELRAEVVDGAGAPSTGPGLSARRGNMVALAREAATMLRSISNEGP